MYRMFFLGQNFLFGPLCTLKPKNLNTFSKKRRFFSQRYLLASAGKKPTFFGKKYLVGLVTINCILIVNFWKIND